MASESRPSPLNLSMGSLASMVRHAASMSPTRMRSPPTKVAFGRHFAGDMPTPAFDNRFVWEQQGIAVDAKSYRMQGDVTMNTRDNLLKRNALRLDPRVKRAIQMIWDMVPKTLNFQVEKKSYIALLVRVCKLVIPEFDLEEARATAETDWERDAKGENTMGYRQFFDAFFELADIWCPDIDGGQYAHFLDTLRLRLTVVTVHKKDGTIVRKTAGVTKMDADDLAAQLARVGGQQYLPPPVVEPYKTAAAKAREAATAAKDAKGSGSSLAGNNKGSTASLGMLGGSNIAKKSSAKDVSKQGRGTTDAKGKRGSTSGSGADRASSQRHGTGPTSRRPTPAGSSRPSQRGGPLSPSVAAAKGDPKAELAATKVQSLVRGKQTRDRVQSIKVAKSAGVEDVEVANAAATKVQAGLRGMRDRKMVSAMKQERDGSASHLAPSAQQQLSDSQRRSGLQSSGGRADSPRPGDKPGVERPSREAQLARGVSRGRLSSGGGKFVDVLAFGHDDVEEGDVVTTGFADLDEIYHCPDLITEEDEEDEEDGDDDSSEHGGARLSAGSKSPADLLSSSLFAMPPAGSVTVPASGPVINPHRNTSMLPTDAPQLQSGPSPIGATVSGHVSRIGGGGQLGEPSRAFHDASRSSSVRGGGSVGSVGSEKSGAPLVDGTVAADAPDSDAVFAVSDDGGGDESVAPGGQEFAMNAGSSGDNAGAPASRGRGVIPNDGLDADTYNHGGPTAARHAVSGKHDELGAAGSESPDSDGLHAPADGTTFRDTKVGNHPHLPSAASHASHKSSVGESPVSVADRSGEWKDGTLDSALHARTSSQSGVPRSVASSFGDRSLDAEQKSGELASAVAVLSASCEAAAPPATLVPNTGPGPRSSAPRIGEVPGGSNGGDASLGDNLPGSTGVDGMDGGVATTLPPKASKAKKNRSAAPAAGVDAPPPASIREMIGARMRGTGAKDSPKRGLLHASSLKRMVGNTVKRFRASAENVESRPGSSSDSRPGSTTSGLLDDDDGAFSASDEEDYADSGLPIDLRSQIPRPLMQMGVDPYLASDDVAATSLRQDLQAPRVLIAGKPGAGKSVLAESLGQVLGVEVVSVDSIVTACLNGTTLRVPELQDHVDAIKTAVECGQEPPMQSVLAVMADKLLELNEVQSGYVLDGHPISSQEYAVLDSVLKQVSGDCVSADNVMPEKIVHLDIGVDDLIIRRTAPMGGKSNQNGDSSKSFGDDDDGNAGGSDTGNGDGGSETLPAAAPTTVQRPSSAWRREVSEFATMTPDEQAAELQLLRSRVNEYNQDAILPGAVGHYVIDATQPPSVVLQQALLLLGEGQPPLSRLAAPPVVPHTITLPEPLSGEDAQLKALEYLLYGDVPELAESRPHPVTSEESDGNADVKRSDDDTQTSAANWPLSLLKSGVVEFETRSKQVSHSLGNRTLSAFGTKCPVTYVETGSVVEGLPRLAVEYQGQVVLCATPEARDAFRNNPKRYMAVRPRVAPTTKMALIQVGGAQASPGLSGSVGTALSALLALPEISVMSLDISKPTYVAVQEAIDAARGISDLTSGTQPGWLMTQAPSSVAYWQDLLEHGIVPDSVVLVAPASGAPPATLAAGDVDSGNKEQSETEGLSGGTTDGENCVLAADDVSGDGLAANVRASPHASTERVAAQKCIADLKNLLESKGVKVTIIIPQDVDRSQSDSTGDGGQEGDQRSDHSSKSATIVALQCQQAVDPFAPKQDAVVPSAAALGDLGKYCPVACVDSGVLVPGKPGIRTTIQGETYFFTDEAAKAKFDANPLLYLHLPTEDAVFGGLAAGLDTPRPLPPPRVLILAPVGCGLEEHLADLARKYDVDVASVPEALLAHPMWGPFYSASIAPPSPPTLKSIEDGDDNANPSDDVADSKPTTCPPEAYTDALKSVFGRSGRRGSLLAGLSQVISPEIAQAMIGRGVPPSLVVPVRFEPSRLAQHRLKSEFAWNPPSVPVGGESKADDGAPPPSPEELETAKEEARSAKLEALVAACNDDRDRLAGVEKVFEEAGVAIATPIDGNANSLDRVLARLEGVIAPVLTGAVSVVTTAASVAPSVVSSLLQSGSRRLSKFGPYCPVALKESGDLVANTEHPVVYRNHVYMLSSSAAAAKFAANPAVYVSQAAPPPKIPPSCAIVGPEFSGRSSAAAAVAKENGMELVTVTRAIEDLLRPESSDTALRRKVLEFLAQGQSLPDALAAEAIAKYVSTLKCAENGYVLDGFPNTPAQAAALSAVGVIPRSVYLLNVPEPELYARAVAATDCETQRLELGLGPQVLTRSLTAVKKIKRRKPTTPAESKLDDDGGGVEDQNGGEDDAADGSDEEHGDARVAMTVRPGEWPEVSARIRSGLLSTEDVLAARSPWNGGHIPVAPDSNRAASIIKRIASQHDNCVQLVDGFAEQFDNVKAIDASGAQSRWGIARAISSSLRDATKHAREYARAVGTGSAASIQDVLISRAELQERAGHTGTYCPVTWATKKELVNMAGTSGQRLYGCEYRGKLYFTAGPAEQEAFLKNPALFLTQPFPVDSKLPVRLLPAELEGLQAKLGMKGLCPVTFFENPENTRYATGNDGLCVLFHNRVFFFDTEDKLRRFMRAPWKYSKQVLPSKIPPRGIRLAPSKVGNEPGKAASVAYLEQTLSEMITNALTAVSDHRTKLLHPNLTISGSLKAFVALHLKAHNAASPPHIRERAEQRLAQFLEECGIADKIRMAAPRGSAVSAARLSPRLPDVSHLGEQFDKLRSEPKQYLLERFLRPDPVTTK